MRTILDSVPSNSRYKLLNYDLKKIYSVIAELLTLILLKCMKTVCASFYSGWFKKAEYSYCLLFKTVFWSVCAQAVHTHNT